MFMFGPREGGRCARVKGGGRGSSTGERIVHAAVRSCVCVWRVPCHLLPSTVQLNLQ